MILVVEDNPDIAETIRDMLNSVGYKSVLWASSGTDAIEIAAAERPDVVLSDIVLGNEGDPDGIEAGRVIRSLYEIPVIFITAHADDDVLQRATRIGASGYIPKSVLKPEVIRTTIEMGVFNFKNFNDAADLIRFSLDPRGRLLAMNALGRREFCPKDFGPRDIPLLDSFVAAHSLARLTDSIGGLPTSPHDTSFEIEARRPNGTVVHLEVSTEAVSFCQILAGIVVSAKDVTLHRLAERKIEASLREKEMLLREVHHRVRNHLATISGLLRGATRTIADGRLSPQGVRDMLADTRQRLDTMAMLHEELYRSEDQASVNARSLVERLLSTISDSMDCDNIKFQSTVEEIPIKLETASPLGLILNEIVTNSVKHAFSRLGSGTVSVSLARYREGSLQLLIQDDGSGFDKASSGTRVSGLSLVTGLVTQLQGTMEVNSSNGTKYIITFPE